MWKMDNLKKIIVFFKQNFHNKRNKLTTKTKITLFIYHIKQNERKKKCF